MINAQNSPWNAARDAELSRLWATGIKTAEIAATMRMSRNQVIGRVHRLGLPKRVNPVNLDAVGRPAPEPRPKKPRPPREVKAKPALRPLRPLRSDFGRPQVSASSKSSLTPEERRARGRESVAHLKPSEDQPLRIDAAFASEAPDHQQPRGCRYVIGSGKGWRYCQDAQVAGLSYCADHGARCYRRPGEEEAA